MYTHKSGKRIFHYNPLMEATYMIGKMHNNFTQSDKHSKETPEFINTPSLKKLKKSFESLGADKFFANARSFQDNAVGKWNSFT